MPGPEGLDKIEFIRHFRSLIFYCIIISFNLFAEIQLTLAEQSINLIRKKKPWNEIFNQVVTDYHN